MSRTLNLYPCLACHAEVLRRDSVRHSPNVRVCLACVQRFAAAEARFFHRGCELECCARPAPGDAELAPLLSALSV